MSQEQMRRPDDDQESIKYEELFSIERKVAKQRNEAAENQLKSLTLKDGGAASAAAAANDASAEKENPMTAESIVGQEVDKNKEGTQSPGAEGPFKKGGGITIGEALEATALTAGQKPVEWSDAAAIQAAEVRATGRTTISPGGVAAAAQSAATLNARIKRDEDKTKLADILSDATSKLPADRPATRKDAEGVTGAEMRNDPFLTTHPAGVAASIAAAARLNQQNSNSNK
ncbi:late embryogenesis abundant protein 47 [Euphorbia lathyris]|uniref:late embryogenesis abundant protein 47 n=1 Tax=Euphorbia lathyris TaxID=212925 RepID=UPI0033137F39